MKQAISSLIDQALNKLREQGYLPAELSYEIQIEATRDKKLGDFASNIALMLAKPLQQAPREVAARIVAALTPDPKITRVEIAGPGFINFFIHSENFLNVIPRILQEKQAYGHQIQEKPERVYLEFISANPTGPLHVGHGRGAAYGDALGNVLQSQGFEVHREYYVNDAGRQMNILALSVWLRYLELHQQDFIFPKNGYRGAYVITIAEHLREHYQDSLLKPIILWWQNIHPDEGEPEGDKEKHVDDLIQAMKNILGPSAYGQVFDLALDEVLSDIKDDLKAFGVCFEHYFSEKELEKQGLLQAGIERLKALGHTYEKDGNLWFKASEFGDEKDRVIVRKNGESTYFASDIAYHALKYEKADRIIDILGADHHGYVARLSGMLEALGLDPSHLSVQIIQFAVLYRGKERVQMSTRSGSFVTLRELREEVGRDAARFFYVSRRHEQHMDFDLELAKSKSNENPVYYIQYAHARICSVFRQLKAQGLSWDEHSGSEYLDRLSSEDEKDLCETLGRYPEILAQAARQYEPHTLAHFLRLLANQFHTYYNSHQFLVDDLPLRQARLNLIAAVRHVLQHALTLLGVSHPEVM